jgi:hypothetical protein
LEKIDSGVTTAQLACIVNWSGILVIGDSAAGLTAALQLGNKKADLEDVSAGPMIEREGL